MSHFNPDQYTEPQQGLQPKDAGEQFADWIDTSVLAQVVGEELVDQGINPTLENCKKAWLVFLLNLHAHIEASIDRPGFDPVKTP